MKLQVDLTWDYFTNTTFSVDCAKDGAVSPACDEAVAHVSLTHLRCEYASYHPNVTYNSLSTYPQYLCSSYHQ